MYEYVSKPISDAFGASFDMWSAAYKEGSRSVAESGLADYVYYAASQRIIKHLGDSHPYLTACLLGILSELLPAPNKGETPKLPLAK